MDRKMLEKLAAEMTSSDVVSLTGAGVSVASGIPDFRSKDGLWSRYNPEIYASYQQFITDPSYFWEMHLDIMEMLQKAEPNPAHNSLAALEEMGIVKGVITQNIDGLHQQAGSHTVYELHGTNDTASCTICKNQYTTREIADHLFSFEKEELIGLMRKGKEIPVCECGGWIKPDVVLFGELMPQEPMLAAEGLAASCDLLLVVGSSLQVQPAASIPFVTKKNGGTLAIIDRYSVPLQQMAEYAVQGNAEDVLPALVDMLQE